MNVIGQRQPVRDTFDCRWRNETKVRHCVCSRSSRNISFVVPGNGSVTRPEKWIRQRVWCQCKGTGANARCETNVRVFTCRLRGVGWSEITKRGSHTKSPRRQTEQEIPNFKWNYAWSSPHPRSLTSVWLNVKANVFLVICTFGPLPQLLHWFVHLSVSLPPSPIVFFAKEKVEPSNG